MSHPLRTSAGDSVSGYAHQRGIRGEYVVNWRGSPYLHQKPCKTQGIKSSCGTRGIRNARDRGLAATSDCFTARPCLRERLVPSSCRKRADIATSCPVTGRYIVPSTSSNLPGRDSSVCRAPTAPPACYPLCFRSTLSRCPAPRPYVSSPPKSRHATVIVDSVARSVCAVSRLAARGQRPRERFLSPRRERGNRR